MNPKRLAIPLIAIVVLALAIPAVSAGYFTDTAGSEHAEAIDWLAEQGIARGCNPPANDLFCPDSPVTRAELASFLQRASVDAEIVQLRNEVERLRHEVLELRDLVYGG